ncbi:MAG: ABC transporter permease [Nitrospirota bacterium]|nr:ABC transporter permease [Nitrospirota bacterium]
MKRIVAIAQVTWREAVRNRILYSLLFFVVLMVVIAAVLDQMTMGQNGRVVADIGLLLIHVFGALITIFLGVAVISREIARKTLYVVLAKPVGRLEFLAGKLLGLTATLAVLMLVMGACLFAVASLFAVPPPLQFAWSLFLTWVELSLLCAVALLFSVSTGPFLSGMFTLGVLVIGHLTPGLREMGVRSGDALVRGVTSALYYLLPNLELFNRKQEVTYRLPVDWGHTGFALLYALAYGAMLFAAAGIIFSRRDFR